MIPTGHRDTLAQLLGLFAQIFFDHWSKCRVHRCMRPHLCLESAPERAHLGIDYWLNLQLLHREVLHVRVPARHTFPACRRPARGYPPVGRRHRGGAVAPDVARGDRFGQDLQHCQRHPAGAAAHAGAGAQQDAGRAVVRGVQGILPQQRGGVLRFLLRLLPAGSLRPFVRHLHREGRLDQRPYRADAPVGDQGAAGAA